METAEEQRTVESYISGEFFMLELSPFLVLRDLKFFLANKSLVASLPDVQLGLLKRSLLASSSGELVETSIRLVMQKFRAILQQIAEITSLEDAATCVGQIEELREIFTHVPPHVWTALARWLPAPPGEPLSPNVIANHCFESLRCRLKHIHACDSEKKG